MKIGTIIKLFLITLIATLFITNPLAFSTCAIEPTIKQLNKSGESLETIRTLIDNGEYERAILEINSFLESNPESGSAYIARAMAYFGLLNRDSAMRDLEKARQLFINTGELDRVQRVEALMQQIKIDLEEMNNGEE